MRKVIPAEERFWSKVKIGEPNDCWEWQAYRNEDGYGAFKVSPRKNNSSHRFAYKLTFGKIPKGKRVLHSCDNPPCCNPKHLFIGTQADNVHDMVSKGRNVSVPKSGILNPAAKLTEEKVKEILRLLAEGKTQKFISELVGISRSRISAIKMNLTWNQIPRDPNVIFPVNRRKDYSANGKNRIRKANGRFA